MTWTKLFLAPLAAGLLLLTGCSGGGEAPAAPTDKPGGETASAGKKLKIGVSIPAADHGWTAGVVYWANEAKKEYPDVEFNIQTADTPQTQISQIETMMTAGLDGLVVLATESAPLTPIAEKVHERGIYLVNVDRGFLKDVADVFVAGDNKAFGKKSAEFMAEKLGGKGKILVLRGIPCTVDTDRFDAAMAVFKEKGIEVLDAQPGLWNKDKALEVTQAMLVKHPKVDAIWASDDDMAEGVEQALKEAGRTGVWILGGAGKKEIIKRTMDKDPLYPGNITYPPAMIKNGIDICVADLKAGKKAGAAPQRQEIIPVEVITPENAKDYYFPDSPF